MASAGWPAPTQPLTWLWLHHTCWPGGMEADLGLWTWMLCGCQWCTQHAEGQQVGWVCQAKEPRSLCGPVWAAGGYAVASLGG